MTLISLDLFMSTDKAYADFAQTDNPFYTSLKPWRREDSGHVGLRPFSALLWVAALT
jgi:hypothetical protein